MYNQAFSKIWIIIIIIIIFIGVFFAYWTIWGKEKIEVKDLAQQFYKSIEEQNGDLAISYFTPPATPAEKERYDWLIAADFPEGQRFFRGFLRVKIANPTIKSIEKLDKGKFQVNLTDDFQSWSNADPVGYGPVVKRDMVIITVKMNNKWLIDEWNYPTYKYEVNKYSGFGQEEIISSNETADWKTYRNEEYGFEMKYPEDFLPTQPLQPKTRITQCNYANFANECPFVPIDGFIGSEESAFRQGFAARPTPERITINGISFCRQENREGAMGTSYITYNYTTAREKECFVVSFTVGYPNCSNYLPAKSQQIQEMYDKCKLDNEVAKPETIDKILSTFKFLEQPEKKAKILEGEILEYDIYTKSTVKGYVKEGGLYSKGKFLEPGLYEVEDYCYIGSPDKPSSEGDHLKEYFIISPDELYFSDRRCNCINGACVKPPSVSSCTETDDGKDIYTKGKIVGIAGGEKFITEFEDYCTEDGSMLLEGFCMSGLIYDYDWMYCEAGCEDGRCIGGTPEFLPVNWPLDKCYDSDGGENYYVKGETYGDYIADRRVDTFVVQKDVCQNENQLNESFCIDDRQSGSVGIECPCSDGACLR